MPLVTSGAARSTVSVPRSGLSHRRPVAVDAHDLAGKAVRRPDELGDEAAGRVLVERPRRGDLQDLAVLHHRDLGRHAERLLLIVGDDDEGDADLGLQAHQLELHLLAELLVEGGERLVEQQQLRPLDQGPGQRHALPLAAGELVGLALGHAAEPDHGDRLLDPGADLGPAACRVTLSP